MARRIASAEASVSLLAPRLRTRRQEFIRRAAMTAEAASSPSEHEKSESERRDVFTFRAAFRETASGAQMVQHRKEAALTPGISIKGFMLGWSTSIPSVATLAGRWALRSSMASGESEHDQKLKVWSVGLAGKTARSAQRDPTSHSILRTLTTLDSTAAARARRMPGFGVVERWLHTAAKSFSGCPLTSFLRSPLASKRPARV
mmetsp:Transcript_3552/g.11024  ORF Transcript_3552/g.11024 Transcript_3552/m.11024 type:complete len:203 (+) Transcript_3552:1060-1668(+)|eukprot:scaffold274397_cov35-Tisochrysis_lutea.AAC.1